MASSYINLAPGLGLRKAGLGQTADQSVPCDLF